MIIECPECGKEVSDQARACPECGCKICSFELGHLIFFVIHFIFLFITFGLGLFISIPLHIIYCVVKKPSKWVFDSEGFKKSMKEHKEREKEKVLIKIKMLKSEIAIAKSPPFTKSNQRKVKRLRKKIRNIKLSEAAGELWGSWNKTKEEQAEVMTKFEQDIKGYAEEVEKCTCHLTMISECPIHGCLDECTCSPDNIGRCLIHGDRQETSISCHPVTTVERGLTKKLSLVVGKILIYISALFGFIVVIGVIVDPNIAIIGGGLLFTSIPVVLGMCFVRWGQRKEGPRLRKQTILMVVVLYIISIGILIVVDMMGI